MWVLMHLGDVWESAIPACPSVSTSGGEGGMGETSLGLNFYALTQPVNFETLRTEDIFKVSYLCRLNVEALLALL